MKCAIGIKSSGVAGEWMQLRWYGSSSSGPLALFKDYVRRGELESGNLAQVCIRTVLCIVLFDCAVVSSVM